MSQEDYDIENQVFPDFRTDLNANLAAIVTNNSGLLEPIATFPYMLWADTTAGIMKQRDGSNTDWIELYNFSGSNTQIIYRDYISGGSIAAGATVDLAFATGKVVNINGNGGPITSFGTLSNGLSFTLIFLGTPVIENSANIILPGGADILAAVGDVMQLVSLDADIWKCTNYTRADGTSIAGSGGTGKVLQVVNVQDNSGLSGSAVIPVDNTIPENTEGTEFLSLAITPTNAISKLIIEITLVHSSSGISSSVVALFQDNVTDALASVIDTYIAVDNPIVTSFSHSIIAGTTSATTFKIRAGPSFGSIDLNGSAFATLGGTIFSSMKITEVEV